MSVNTWIRQNITHPLEPVKVQLVKEPRKVSASTVQPGIVHIPEDCTIDYTDYAAGYYFADETDRIYDNGPFKTEALAVLGRERYFKWL